MKVTLNLELEIGDRQLHIRILPAEDGLIARHQLLHEPDIPEEYYEIAGMIWATEPSVSDRTTLHTILRVSRIVLPLAKTVAAGRPLMWICSRRHALLYERILPGVRIVRGSLRNDNPYPLLAVQWGPTGGSEDEHVLQMLEAT